MKVGDRFKTNKGGDVIVVEYNTCKDIIVEFDDKYKYQVKVRVIELLKGDIKNPYAARLFDVGYFGVGKYKSKEGSATKGFASLPAYAAWTNMLSRCYDKNYMNRSIYEEVTVDPDWHNFQIFAEWYTNELKYTGWQGGDYLDKDILSDDKIYSAQTCCIVPARLNSIVNSKHKNTKLLQGVRKGGKNFRVVPGYDVSDIRFNSEIDAHIAYVDSKVSRIKELAKYYKEYLNPKVYNILMTKDFRYKYSHLYRSQNK